MKNVNVNAKEIIKKLAKPKMKRVSLYVPEEVYDAVRALVGQKNVSEATVALWQKLIDSAGKK